jgi:hypothetical protein
MGAYEKVSQEKLFSISKKYLFSYLRSPIVAYPWTRFVAPFLYLTDLALSIDYNRGFSVFLMRLFELAISGK